MIGLALENYRAAIGHYPPVYVADANGNPLYSWRVLILPFLEHGNLYKQFDLSEPWDSPSNKQLSGIALASFQCPCTKSKGNITSYVLVSGPGTAWPDGRDAIGEDLGPDAADTVLVVEVADSKIPWSKPQDLKLSELSGGINLSDSNGISSFHARDWNSHFKNGRPGANILFADGHVEFVLAPGDPAKLKQWLTVEQ